MKKLLLILITLGSTCMLRINADGSPGYFAIVTPSVSSNEEGSEVGTDCQHHCDCLKGLTCVKTKNGKKCVKAKKGSMPVDCDLANLKI